VGRLLIRTNARYAKITLDFIGFSVKSQFIWKLKSESTHCQKYKKREKTTQKIQMRSKDPLLGYLIFIDVFAIVLLCCSYA